MAQGGGDPAMAAARGLAQFASITGVPRAAAPLEQAIAMARKAGNPRAEAQGAERSGDVALRRSDHAGARQRYEEALPLYRQVGAVLGEANCIRSLGDIALRDSRAEEARERFQAALDLYRRIPEPYSIGWALCRLARIEKDKSKRADLLAQIASVWMGIDREDLVEGLRREFPGEA
jgi:tetratricopeptide (TPR) repeat protein